MSLRMTAWYAGTAFLLVLLATSFLSWSFGKRISGQEDRTLLVLARIARPLASAAEPSSASRAIASALERAGSAREIQFRIIGPHGRIALQSQGNHLPLPSSAGLPDVRTLDSSGTAFRVLTQRLPNGGMLQVAIATPGAQALLLRYRETLTLILAVSIVLCAMLGYLIARSGMRPIERIAETAEHIRLSTLHERLDVEKLPAELAALANTFNLMLDRLEQSFLQLSQFSADLAHELRTPISNLRGELEVALSRPRSDDIYREVLGSALEECTRVSRVIQSLLFLARAEMVGNPPALETLDLCTEISTVLEFYQPMAVEAGLSLTVHAQPGIQIQFDRILLQQALGNLVANAIAHTAAGGQIIVEVAGNPEQLVIRIRDTGQGIAPEHLPHVFGRFYRADRARSHVSGNLGLGLAVVRAIMDLHGGRVAIESRQGQGTTVSLLVAAPRI